MSAKKHFTLRKILLAVPVAVMQHFASFEGRITRLRYWVRMPIYYAIYFVAIRTDLIINDEKIEELAFGPGYWFAVVAIAISIITFTLSLILTFARRCSDIGINYNYSMIVPPVLWYLPILGIVTVVSLGCIKTDAARTSKGKSILFSFLPFSRKYIGKKKRKRKR